MESPNHSINALFAQLGLECSDEAIEAFIDEQAPIPAGVLLHEGAMWSSAQADFLHQALEEDADWAEVVDHLDALLRDPQA